LWGKGRARGSHILPSQGKSPSLLRFAMRSEDSLTRSCQDLVPSWPPCVQGPQSRRKVCGTRSGVVLVLPLQGSRYLHPAGDHWLGAVTVLTNLPLTFCAGRETVRWPLDSRRRHLLLRAPFLPTTRGNRQSLDDACRARHRPDSNQQTPDQAPGMSCGTTRHGFQEKGLSLQNVNTETLRAWMPREGCDDPGEERTGKYLVVALRSQYNMPSGAGSNEPT
jgi:hypothetical protein